MTFPGFSGFSAIAVALDGSLLAEETLPIVKELGRRFQARVSVITVLDGHVEERFADFCHGEGVALVEAVRSYQDKIIKDLRREGLLVAGHVTALRKGTAATILEVAEHVNASLLVIGSHGRSGMKRMVLGSVAEEITRTGRIPLLVVRPAQSEVLSPV